MSQRMKLCILNKWRSDPLLKMLTKMHQKFPFFSLHKIKTKNLNHNSETLSFHLMYCLFDRHLYSPQDVTVSLKQVLLTGLYPQYWKLKSWFTNREIKVKDKTHKLRT